MGTNGALGVTFMSSQTSTISLSGLKMTPSEGAGSVAASIISWKRACENVFASVELSLHLELVEVMV